MAAGRVEKVTAIHRFNIIFILYTEKRDNSTSWKFSRDIISKICPKKRDVPPKNEIVGKYDIISHKV